MTRPRFTIAAAGIIALYLAIAIAYAVHAPRWVDEYVNAYTLNQVRENLPYRDFRPPKTVVGFYSILPPMLLMHDAWDGMTAAKVELALLAAAALAAAAFVLRRRLNDLAVLGALALLVVMSNFLERSAELRPDAIATLFGLASLLCLITRRPLLAGFACAAAFLSTQKGIYFVAAGEVALIASWLRERSRQECQRLLLYNAAAAATLAAYIVFWSLLSSFQAVLSSMFFDPNVRAIALTNIYDVRAAYWSQTLVRNPFFYAFTAAGLLLLGSRWMRRKGDAVVWPYALTLLAFAIWHKQPWPYFFAMIAPTLFVLHAFTLDDLLSRPWSRLWQRVFVVVFVVAGLLLPLSRVPAALMRDGGFHRAMFEAGEQLLGPGETYIDGINMLYQRRQAHPAFEWLDAAGMKRLGSLSADNQRAITVELDRNPPKLVIWNYRMAGLPPILQIWIRTHYAPIYGDIFLYAPFVRGTSFTIAFDGRYHLDAPLIIDGAPVSGDVVLHRGVHALSSATPVRLHLIPPPGVQVDLRYAAPQNLFGEIYAF